MSIKARLVESSVWIVVSFGLSGIASFAVFAVLARLLDPATIGIVALAMVAVEFGRLVAFGGLPEALVQREAWDDDVASSCFWANILLALALAAAFALVGLAVVPAWRGAGAVEGGQVLAALGAVVVVDAARAIHDAKIRREFAYRRVAAREALATLVAGGLGIGLAFAGFGVWALVAHRVLSAVISTLLTWSVARWSPRLRLRRDDLRSVAAFAARYAPARMLTVLNARATDLLIGLFLGPAALAYYRVAGRSLDVVSQLTLQPVQRAALPAFSRVGEPAAIGAAYRRVTALAALLTCPVYFGLAAVGPDLVHIIFGPGWAPSGAVLPWLALGVGASTLAAFVQPALAAANRSDLALRSAVVSFGSAMIVSLASLPFGLNALAASHTARQYLSIPFWLGLVRTGVGLPRRGALRSLLPALASAAVMLAGVLALRETVLVGWSPLARILACAAAGAPLYALVLFVAFRGAVREALAEVTPFLPARLRGTGRRKP